MKPSEAAAEAIAAKWGYAEGESFYYEGMERAGETLMAVPDDGDPRDIMTRLDALAELEAEARELPHHGHIVGNHRSVECIDCGLPWPCPTERIRCLLPEASQ